MVFMAGHAAVELVFSAYHYLPIAFGVMAVIGLTCGEAIPKPKLKPKAQTVAAWTAAAMLTVFGVQITGSIMAYKALENDTPKPPEGGVAGPLRVDELRHLLRGQHRRRRRGPGGQEQGGQVRREA